MKKYLTLLAGAMFLTACYNDAEDIASKDGYQPSQEAVSFDVATQDATITRAVTGEITNAGLQSLSTLTFATHPSATTGLRGFGAFASYTGRKRYESTTVAPDFMYNQQVINGTSAWEYNPVKYWPNDEYEYVTFFAYAPYEPAPANDGRCIIDMSKNDEEGDPNIVYRISEDPWNTDGDEKTEPQVDLMYGFNNTTSTAQKPWYDQNRKDYGVNPSVKRLTYTFAHALACFANEVTLKITPDLCALLNGYSTVKINSFTITYNDLTSKARLVLNPLIDNVTIGGNAQQIVQPNWKQIVSGEVTTSRTTGEITKYPTANAATALADMPIDLTSSAAEYKISEDRGLFYIPMKIVGAAKPTVTVTLNYTITVTATGDEFTSDATASIDLPLTYELPSTEKVSAAGYKFGLELRLSKDLDLLHQVYVLGGAASDPSYSRELK